MEDIVSEEKEGQGGMKRDEEGEIGLWPNGVAV